MKREKFEFDEKYQQSSGKDTKSSGFPKTRIKQYWKLWQDTFDDEYEEEQEDEPVSESKKEIKHKVYDKPPSKTEPEKTVSKK